MNKLIRNNKIKLYTLAAFIIPATFILFLFFINNITPFGKKSILYNDLEIQIVPFLSELSYKLKHGESIFYSFRQSLGYDFFNQSCYYLNSPLNLFCVFFNSKNMPLFISILLVAKSGLCGITMHTYLTLHFKKNTKATNQILTLAFSTCYALCGYIFYYYLLIMWLDSMILLPIIILGFEKLFYDKKPLLYCITLACSIIFNFYTAYMICIFLLLLFIHHIFIHFNELSINEKLSKACYFAGYSMLAAGISCVTLFPMLNALRGAKASSTLSNPFSSNYSVLDLLYGQFINATNLHSLFFYKNLYCGLIVLILFLLYFFDFKQNLRIKIANLFLLLSLFASFYFPVFEYIWNGFHIPNGYTRRNAFIFIFLLISISYEYICNSENKNKKTYYCCFLSFFTISILVLLNVTLTRTQLNVIFNVFVCLIYLVLIWLLTSKYKTTMTLILSIMIFAELFYTGFYSFNVYDSDDYNNEQAEWANIGTTISDDGISRTVNLYSKNLNSGSLFLYNDIGNVSSVSTNSILQFLSDNGMYSALNSTVSPSFEPVFYSLMGEKYIVSPYEFKNCSFLNEINRTKNTYIYENPYAVSIGFPNNNINSLFSSKEIPFEKINKYAKDKFGIGEIYIKCSVSLNNNKIALEPGHEIFVYSKDKLNGAEFISESGTIKLYDCKMLAICIRRDFYRDNHTYYIPNSKKGGYIQLNDDFLSSIASTNDLNLNIYYLDLDNFKTFINRFKKNELKILESSDNSIKASVVSDKNQIYTTSISYSEGWSLTIDGKKDDILPNGPLLSFRLTKGKHTISLHYTTRYFIVGLITTIVSLLLLFVILPLLYRLLFCRSQS